MAVPSAPSPTEETPLLGTAKPGGSSRQTVIIGVAILALAALAAIVFGGGSGESWQAIGSASQHPLALLISAGNPSEVLAGTEAGQVLVTGDGGATWGSFSAGLPSGIVISALAQPPDGSRLYAGTNAGVFTSATNNAAWTRTSLAPPDGDTVDALAVSPTTPGLVLAGATRHGVFRSADGGLTWTAATGLPAGADIYSLVFLPDGHTAYAGLIDGGGVAISHDGGQTWTVYGAGLPVERKIFVILPIVDSNHQLTQLDAGTSAGLYISHDGGQTWTASTLTTTRVIALATDPQIASIVVAGTDNGVYESGDAGADWKRVAAGWPAQDPVAAVLVSHPQGSATIIYAAANQAYRFPGQNFTANIGGTRLLGIFALVGVLLFLGVRQNRVLRTLTPNAPAPGQVSGVLPAVGAPRANRAATAHIRGGPRPIAPTIFPDRGGPMTLNTRQGAVPAIFVPVLGTRRAAIYLGTADAPDGPADLFVPLAERLQGEQVLGLRLRFRDATDHETSLADTLAAVTILARHGIERVALFGFESAAALAVAAARANETVAGVVLLAPSALPGEDLAAITPRPVLIIQGLEDDPAAVRATQELFAAAAEPKALSLVPGAGHDLAGARDGLIRQIAVWSRERAFAPPA